MRSSQRSAQRANPARIHPAVPSRSHHTRQDGVLANAGAPFGVLGVSSGWNVGTRSCRREFSWAPMRGRRQEARISQEVLLH